MIITSGLPETKQKRPESAIARTIDVERAIHLLSENPDLRKDPLGEVAVADALDRQQEGSRPQVG